MKIKKWISLTLTLSFLCGVSKQTLFAGGADVPYGTDRSAYPIPSSQEKNPGMDYSVIGVSRHTAMTAGLRSVVIPGWGQMFNGESRKGVVILGTTLAAAGLSYMFYEESSDSYDKYKNSGVRNDPHYDDYSRERTVSLAFGGLAAVVWSYSIINAFANGSSPKSARASNIQVALNSEGGEVTWQRKF